jgi:DNA-binding CsgD family transcriptional regulator
LNTDEALFAGGYSVREITQDNQKLSIEKGKNFYSYNQDNGRQFVGLHNIINMYPRDSAFNSEIWAAALIMPKEDIVSSIIKLNMEITLLFAMLLLFGVIISYYLSRRYIKPITKSIDIIKSNNYSKALKTNIHEIDDLMEFLSSHRDENNTKIELQEKEEDRNENKKLTTTLFDEFQANTKTLSPAERSVFNLYVEGYTAKEITGILGLSINTIKTHNKRIYMKLNVTSREELLLYVNMLKEAGREVNN